VLWRILQWVLLNSSASGPMLSVMGNRWKSFQRPWICSLTRPCGAEHRRAKGQKVNASRLIPEEELIKLTCPSDHGSEFVLRRRESGSKFNFPRFKGFLCVLRVDHYFGRISLKECFEIERFPKEKKCALRDSKSEHKLRASEQLRPLGYSVLKPV